MQVKPKQAFSIICKFLMAKLTVMLAGSPGIGKSSIIQDVANQFNLKLIDMRLAQADPTDLLGMPTIINGRSAYAPFNTFPLENDPLPEGYSGWIIFFDEMTAAAPAVQAASYKIILDRMVGLHKLHKNVAIVCAGNLETDNAIVEPMSTALQSRLVHLELTADAKEWTEWAAANGIHPNIVSYIDFRPGNLMTFDPDHSDKTYACPRTWEFASRVMSVTEQEDDDRLIMLTGTLGEGVANEFNGFCKIFDTLPKMDDLLAKPLSVPIPTDPGTVYALTGAIAHYATPDNIEGLMKFIERLPMEFQVVTMRSTTNYQKVAPANDAMVKWSRKLGAAVF
jgi:hypothetical protein